MRKPSIPRRPPQRLIIIKERGPRAGARLIQQASNGTWLALGIVVLAAIQPQIQPLAMIALVVWAVVHLGLCLTAIFLGSPLRGLLFGICAPVFVGLTGLAVFSLVPMK